jgi:hypothetical protein
MASPPHKQNAINRFAYEKVQFYPASPVRAESFNGRFRSIPAYVLAIQASTRLDLTIAVAFMDSDIALGVGGGHKDR